MSLARYQSAPTRERLVRRIVLLGQAGKRTGAGIAAPAPSRNGAVAPRYLDQMVDVKPWQLTRVAVAVVPMATLIAVLAVPRRGSGKLTNSGVTMEAAT